MAELLDAGKTIPEFETVDQHGKRISSRDMKGKVSVIYFYPKDDTPGCTTEACEFRDSMEEYRKNGIEVYGISVDSENSHKKFNDKYSLNFTLLADKEKSISEKFGVLGGRVASRVTFIVDRDGKIRYVFPKVSPKGHSAEVIGKIRELNLI
ncbi:MAG: peroxiredoxin [Candidatus Thermoplasmatota archaeon]|jgi:peroxiredoxin Q/BCP|nr:peroxiredoxin [Candidatus Thermoplasmatota archaeon]MCL5790450.1 peroxiredoxin [Candidatus Thermoplasmatota archaeon]